MSRRTAGKTTTATVPTSYSTIPPVGGYPGIPAKPVPTQYNGTPNPAAVVPPKSKTHAPLAAGGGALVGGALGSIAGPAGAIVGATAGAAVGAGIAGRDKTKPKGKK